MKPIITLTNTAIKQCLSIVKHHNATALHFSIKSGGCNGFQYKFEPTMEILDKNDELYTDPSKKLNIYVCGTSLLHVLGTEIDWKRDLMGEAFHFNNPKAVQQCGCGTSFNTE